MPRVGTVHWVTKIFENGKLWGEEFPTWTEAYKATGKAFKDSRVVGVLITKDRFGERNAQATRHTRDMD